MKKYTNFNFHWCKISSLCLLCLHPYFNTFQILIGFTFWIGNRMLRVIVNLDKIKGRGDILFGLLKPCWTLVEVRQSKCPICNRPLKYCSFVRYAASVPTDFSSVLDAYTRRGFRVLALAARTLPASLTYTKLQKLAREELECEMRLCGLLVMENRVKPESTPSIDTLHNADIRSLMVTGIDPKFYTEFRTSSLPFATYNVFTFPIARR